MTIRSTFRILVLLSVLLTFSSHSVFGRSPRPTKPEVEIKLPEFEIKQSSAKVQAKQDAEADLNKALLIGNSFAVPVLPVLGLFVGSLVPQSGSVGSFPFTLSNQQALGLCVGLTGCLGPFISIHRHQPTPPPERFIGKSPEYIAVYTDVYETRTGRLKKQYIAVGIGIGCGVLVGLQAITELIMED